MSRIHAPYPADATLSIGLSISSSFTGLSPSMVLLSSRVQLHNLGVPIPTSFCTFMQKFGLPCAAFARCYLQHNCCYLLLRVLRCFNSPRVHSQWIPGHSRDCLRLRNFGIKTCMRLPQTYRSLPRLSSLPKPSYPSNSLKKTLNSSDIVCFLCSISRTKRSEYAREHCYPRTPHHSLNMMGNSCEFPVIKILSDLGMTLFQSPEGLL